MKKGMRVAALVLVCILLLSMGAPAMAAEYSRYSQAKAAVSNDSTIIMRVNPDSSTQAENVVKTFSRVEGKTFELLGETGDWYYARYEGSEGFVRKKDFDLQTASASTASTTTPQYSKFSAAKSGAATDSAIWMRAAASQDAEVPRSSPGSGAKPLPSWGRAAIGTTPSMKGPRALSASRTLRCPARPRRLPTCPSPAGINGAASRYPAPRSTIPSTATPFPATTTNTTNPTTTSSP